jgi:transcriptional regulator with XRE-family HTH domain
MKSTQEQLAQGRHNKGETVRVVASALGLSPQTISYAENKNLSRKMVSEKTIRRLAEYYGLDGEKIEAQYIDEQAARKAKKNVKSN